MPLWFRRLAEIPGVGYQGSPGIDRQRLPDHNAVPEIHQHTFEGKTEESLWWKQPNGGTSASPASQWHVTPRPGETPAQTALRQLYEKVELPGEISDYHFAIQQAIEALWRYRAQEPWVLEEMEKLCWLDFRLITRSLKEFQGAEGSLPLISSFDRLLTLFDREGYVREALELAEFAVQLGAHQRVAETLRVRVAVLDEEGNA